MPVVTTTAERPLKIRCDCCRPRLTVNGWGHDVEVFGPVLAAIQGGVLVIKAWRKHGVGHRRGLTPRALQALPPTTTLRCDCCGPTKETIVGEVIAGTLTIRTKTHGKIHFVVLSPERLNALFAEAGKTRYP